MAKITYDNKSYLNQNGSIPNANKVCDSDMNEIKTVVNNNYDEEKADILSFYYAANDTYEIGGTSGVDLYHTSGFISGASQTVLFTITTPKLLDNVSTVVVHSLNLVLRGINGYLNNQSSITEYVNATGYTISTGIVGKNSITIRINKSSAFTNATNNTPVSITGYINLTLM